LGIVIRKSAKKIKQYN